ncbi:MAG TPA: glycosyltransferase family 4 protein [Rhizomicrobium sp.]
MTGQLHLLLAPKERFEPGGAGAFALNVVETSRVSRFRDATTVFGSPVGTPFDGVRFQPLQKARWWDGDRNKAMARRYAEHAATNLPGLVEVYNRPVMIDILRRALVAVPIALHFGNDPRTMDGSRSAAARRKLLQQSSAVICVSEFIRRCFLDGVDDPLSARVQVIHTGVPYPQALPPKEKRIVYVGRVVPEKGVLELVRALAFVLPRYPDWSAEVIGARWFGSGAKATAYENSVALAASSCERIVLSGFRPHDDVLDSLGRAAIALVPSLWDDPFPRTALEALAQGCALVSSTRGGLPELGPERALYLESVSAESLSGALEQLIADADRRNDLQRRGREDFPFDIRRTTSLLDDLRERLMSPP